MPEQAIVAGATVGSAATVVAASAVQDGLDPTTGWAGGLVIAGVAVFLYMDRRAEKARRESIDERRKDDVERSERIARLESDLAAERAAHVESVRELNAKIIEILGRQVGGTEN